MFSSADHGVRTSTAQLTTYPGEEPTRAQTEEWLDENGPILRRSGFGPAMRGVHPPQLMSLALSSDIPDVAPLTAVERKDAGPIEAAKHDQLRAETARKKEASRQQLRAGLLEYHNRLAAMIETAMRPTASLRLEALLNKHAVDGADDCHNGGAMWRDLYALRDDPGRLEDVRDHDREVESMRDNKLPDGCSAQMFADKVNKLIRVHLKNLERPLLGDTLGRFIIQLMPECNAAEGRALARELKLSGNLNNYGVVVQRFTDIVKLSTTLQSTPNKVLAALGAEHDPKLAALVAAMYTAGINPANLKPNPDVTPKVKGRGARGSGKSKAGDDKKDKKGATRLPDGKLCKAGTCPFNHDEIAPGQPCYRDPKFHGPLPEKYCSNPSQVARIEADRKTNAHRMGIPYKPLTLATANVAVVEVDDAVDGLDYSGLFPSIFMICVDDVFCLCGEPGESDTLWCEELEFLEDPCIFDDASRSDCTDADPTQALSVDVSSVERGSSVPPVAASVTPELDDEALATATTTACTVSSDHILTDKCGHKYDYSNLFMQQTYSMSGASCGLCTGQEHDFFLGPHSASTTVLDESEPSLPADCVDADFADCLSVLQPDGHHVMRELYMIEVECEECSDVEGAAEVDTIETPSFSSGSESSLPDLPSFDSTFVESVSVFSPAERIVSTALHACIFHQAQSQFAAVAPSIRRAT